ncbi:MAG: histidinol-phosphate transaminase [Saprospiraceae bacterium]|nr:histidinol-phosphate transaminase [Saprospiraceae bacterium]
MNLDSLVRENIRQLKPYSSARSEFEGRAEVYLDANENPFETGLNRYPDPLQVELKGEIGHLKKVDPERIFIGNGSDEIIDLLIRIFCEPRRDQIVILPPTYGMYRVSADIADVGVLEVPLSSSFEPRPEAVLEKAGPNTKVLFLCSPNNPTGNCFERSRVEHLLSQFPGIVVVDEAYIDFSSAPSLIELLDDYPNLVVMQTFSKAWGLAGLRLGMAFTSKESVGLLNKVKPPYNINRLSQQAALNALQDREKVEKRVRTILGQRAVLVQYLTGLNFVEKIYPSETNFVLVKVSAPDHLYDYLVDRGIVVRNRSKVQLCAGCIRITVGRPEENERLFQELLDYRAPKNAETT